MNHSTCCGKIWVKLISQKEKKKEKEKKKSNPSRKRFIICDTMTKPPLKTKPPTVQMSLEKSSEEKKNVISRERREREKEKEKNT